MVTPCYCQFWVGYLKLLPTFHRYVSLITCPLITLSCVPHPYPLLFNHSFLFTLVYMPSSIDTLLCLSQYVFAFAVHNCKLLPNVKMAQEMKEIKARICESTVCQQGKVVDCLHPVGCCPQASSLHSIARFLWNHDIVNILYPSKD